MMVALVMVGGICVLVAGLVGLAAGREGAERERRWKREHRERSTQLAASIVGLEVSDDGCVTGCLEGVSIRVEAVALSRRYEGETAVRASDVHAPRLLAILPGRFDERPCDWSGGCPALPPDALPAGCEGWEVWAEPGVAVEQLLKPDVVAALVATRGLLRSQGDGVDVLIEDLTPEAARAGLTALFAFLRAARLAPPRG